MNISDGMSYLHIFCNADVPENSAPFKIDDALIHLEFPIHRGHSLHEVRTQEIPVLAEGDQMEAIM